MMRLFILVLALLKRFCSKSSRAFAFTTLMPLKHSVMADDVCTIIWPASIPSCDPRTAHFFLRCCC